MPQLHCPEFLQSCLVARPRNPRIPVPPRPDLAGKIAGIFPIPIGRDRENIRDFRPDPDSAGISGNRGIPIWPGSGNSRDLRLN